MEDKREVVEDWLDDLCQRINDTVNDTGEWSQAFISQVQAADDCGLIVVVDKVTWYTPDDEDVDYLYPIACVSK